MVMGRSEIYKRPLNEYVPLFFNLKVLLTLLLFLWVSGSFIFFARKNIENSRYERASIQAQSVKDYLDLYKKDLRFKLAQWVYNYHLVKTQGIEFDQGAFLNSEFQSMFFFSYSKNQFEVQWVKSKDIGEADVPAVLLKKNKAWTFDELVKHRDFIFSSQQSNNLGAQVFFGFPVDDPVMGKGLIASTLDPEYLKLSSFLDSHHSSQNLFPAKIVDSSGAYILHSKSEYIGQNAIEDQDSHYLFPVLGTGLRIFVQKSKISWLSFVALPVGVMLSGLLLLLGLLLFEVVQSLKKGSVMTPFAGHPVKNGETGLDSHAYEAILKQGELRDNLNKISLLSSSLKGRLDLALVGNGDQDILNDLIHDFESLDNFIERTYKFSQEKTDETPRRSKPHVQKKPSSRNPSPRDFSPKSPSFKSPSLKSRSDEDGVKVSSESFESHLGSSSFDMEPPSSSENFEIGVSEKMEAKTQQIQEELLNFKEEHGGLDPSMRGKDLSFEIFDEEFLEEEEWNLRSPKPSSLDVSSGVSSGVSSEDSSDELSDNSNWSKVIEELTNELNSIDSDWEGSERLGS